MWWVVGSWFAVREYRLAHSGEPMGAAAVMPILLLGLSFSGIIAGWALQ